MPVQSMRSLAHALQASASGQPGVDFAEEDHAKDDHAQPDVRCLIQGRAAEAVEAKPGEHHATAPDWHGIDNNWDAFGKVRPQH